MAFLQFQLFLLYHYFSAVEGVLSKIEEEIAEIRAVYQHSQQKAQEELGDLLFAVSNLALWFESDAEQLLRLGTDKFKKRFALVERFMKADKLKWDDCDLDILQSYWNRAKAQLLEPTSVDAN